MYQWVFRLQDQIRFVGSIFSDHEREGRKRKAPGLHCLGEWRITSLAASRETTCRSRLMTAGPAGARALPEEELKRSLSTAICAEAGLLQLCG